MAKAISNAKMPRQDAKNPNIIFFVDVSITRLLFPYCRKEKKTQQLPERVNSKGFVKTRYSRIKLFEIILGILLAPAKSEKGEEEDEGTPS